MSNIDWLISLAQSQKHKEWYSDLMSVLSSSDITELPNNPETHNISFALNRAKIRLDNSIKLNKKTFGLNSLINSLENLDHNSNIDFYLAKNKEYTGTCFVLKNELIGCEFVRTTGTKTMRGLWVDGKKQD